MTFNPKTQTIKELAQDESAASAIKRLETLLTGRVSVYIDHANVTNWSNRLGWHIDIRRLKHLLDSFDTVDRVVIYLGTLEGDPRSEDLIKNIQRNHYTLVTKPVKLMQHSLDVSSLENNEDPSLLKPFVRQALLRELTEEQIQRLNQILKELNEAGIKEIEDRKCNLDIEMGSDIRMDLQQDKFDTCVLWSGDSDFVYPAKEVLERGKKLVLFPAGRTSIASELRELRTSGALFFDIRKIKKFICWPREIDGE